MSAVQSPHSVDEAFGRHRGPEELVSMVITALVVRSTG